MMAQRKGAGMDFMYVDESGDGGRAEGGSPVFVLSGIILPSTGWHEAETYLMEIRQKLARAYGWPVRNELRASQIMRTRTMAPERRVAMLKDTLSAIANIPQSQILLSAGVKADLSPDCDVFTATWQTHLGQFEDRLAKLSRHRPPPKGRQGLVLCDDTHGGKLIRLMRRLRRERWVNRRSFLWFKRLKNRPLRWIVEDPQQRDSRASLLLQAADLCAYAAFQSFYPNRYIQEHAPEGLLSALHKHPGDILRVEG